jgi:hypothetical protein
MSFPVVGNVDEEKLFLPPTAQLCDLLLLQQGFSASEISIAWTSAAMGKPESLRGSGEKCIQGRAERSFDGNG